jgi:tripartite-type tricarboxylate transporter receptor subunit TctC
MGRPEVALFTRVIGNLAVVLLALAGVGHAEAQSFPTKAIKLIVSSPAGGSVDQLARSFAAGADETLKVPIEVANKPGAAGAAGLIDVAKASPDGYTLLFIRSTMIADGLARTGLKFSELTPVALLTANPLVLVVAADSQWQDIETFAAHAAAKPGDIRLGLPGGEAHQAASRILGGAIGNAQLTAIPFKSDADAVKWLLNRELSAVLVEPNAIAAGIQDGKLRVLAVAGAKRLAMFDGVRTFKEAGYPDMEFYIWTGLLAPPGTPEPVVKVLREIARSASRSTQVQGSVQKLGLTWSYEDAPEFKIFMENDLKRIQGVRKEISREDGIPLMCQDAWSTYRSQNCEVVCTPTCRGLGQGVLRCDPSRAPTCR